MRTKTSSRGSAGSRGRWLELFSIAVLAGVPSTAFDAIAQPLPSSEVEAPATAELEQPTSVEWARSYDLARRHLYEGDFTAAEREFTALASVATREQDRALASELSLVSRTFRERGARFAPMEEENAEKPARNERTTDELAWLYTSSVLYGFGTGAWLAFQTKPESVAGAILPALGIAGLAVGTVAFVDSQKTLKYGVPQAITTGLELGLGEGVTWALFNQASVHYDHEWKPETLATVVWGSATLGGVAGALIGSVTETTPGRTSLVGSGGLWTATVAGLLTAGMSGDAHGQRDDYALLAGGVGVNVGALGGALLAGPMSPSVARVRFMDLGAIAGGLVAGGIYASASNGFRGSDRDGVLRGFYATTGLGIAAGLGAAAYFTRGMTKDLGRKGRVDARNALALHVEPTFAPVMGGGVIGAAGTF
jgi:hypothetical protein